ncbi:MAG TPA: thioredoxin family protein [Thermoanaerobaculia bacterium]|nr:thioredoxin family protein [Thermoanaerobaculia bacterium]
MRKLFVSMLLLAACANAEELPIGATAPKFALVNAVDGKTVAYKPGDGKVSVVFFTCNQCPYAKAFEPRLIEIAKQYQAKGVAFYAIDPNDEAQYAVESLAEMKARAVERGYPFPYLKDGDSAIARAYGARVTPHVYVFDKTGTLRYRGYVDDSAKASERKTAGLSNALEELLGGKTVSNQTTRAFGCSIKWKS